MKAVLDTNVVMSGIFFAGLPGRVLSAWREERFTLVMSPAILIEYRRVGDELARKFKVVDVSPLLDLLTVHAEIIEAAPHAESLSRDPSDDKFLVCAASCRGALVSGDKDLLACDGRLGVRVLTPREFLTSLDRS